MVDLAKIEPVVVEYVAHILGCPHCLHVTAAKLSPEAAYGAGPLLTAWVASLVGRYRVSTQDTADLVSALLNVPICKDTVQACREQASRALAGPVGEQEQSIRE